MVDNNTSDTIPQTDALQMATESNAIPKTDSFSPAPKHDDSAPKDSGIVGDGGTAANDKSNTNGHHVRRFSTGNIAVPYSKVKILSRYLASSSAGSCHDYCKYGMRREGDPDEETSHHHDHSPTLMKRFNDALGKGHQMFKHTATLMERRKKRSIHVIPTTKTAALSFDSPKSADSPNRSRSEVRRGAKVVHSPRRLDSENVASKHHAGGGMRSRLNSSSASALAVVDSSKLESRRDATPNLVRSKTTLSKVGASELGLVSSPPPRYEKHRRSKSVSKVETSSSYSSPSVDKLPIFSKIYSSSPTIVSEVGVSSALSNPKFQRIEAFISPLHRRGDSMSKFPLSSFSSSSSVKEVEEGSKSKAEEGSKATSPGSSKKSLLPKSLSAKEDRKDLRSKRLEEASVSSSPIEGLRKSRSSSVRTEQKGFGADVHQEKLGEKGTITSPARHKFLRRQSISEPLRSPGRKLTAARSENRKTVMPPLKEDHHQHPNNLKKIEAEETKDEKGSDEKAAAIVVNENKTVKSAANATEMIKSSSLVSQAKHEANSSSTKSSGLTRKRFKRAQNNVHQSPLFHEKYRILRRTGARSVASEPMGGTSDDGLSVMSSTDSCETDHVLEQKALERVLASRINAYASRGTRRRALMNIGGQKDEQPRRLKFRPGRVIEFKSEINSPCRRLKFKRRSAPRNNGIGSPKSNVGMIFGVLRKAGGRRESSSNHRVQFADAVDAEKVVLRHQEMQQEKGSPKALSNNVIEETASKLAEDRKSKVKALVGAFESLITLQDSKPSPTVTA